MIFLACWTSLSALVITSFLKFFFCTLERATYEFKKIRKKKKKFDEENHNVLNICCYNSHY